MLDRNEKINRIKSINTLISEKKQLIEKEKKELALLQMKLEGENKSELPVLINVTGKEALSDSYPSLITLYRYAYYFPELDEIKYFLETSSDVLLPNTIDLREHFMGLKALDMDDESTSFEYYVWMMHIKSYLKAKIDGIFESHEINSWNDIGEHLVNQTINKEDSKIMKFPK